MNIFDKKYYETNNYTNYLERKDRYIKSVNEILDFLEKLNLFPKEHVLDFGCAVGFVLEALQERKIEKIYGVDISDWAIQEATKKGFYIRKTPIWEQYHNAIFALDVFEHMEIEELNYFFNYIKTGLIIFRVPVCANNGEDYVLEVSRNDPTHIIKWTKQQWKQFFKHYGYTPIDLNLHTIYVSEGVYAGLAVR